MSSKKLFLVILAVESFVLTQVIQLDLVNSDTGNGNYVSTTQIGWGSADNEFNMYMDMMSDRAALASSECSTSECTNSKLYINTTTNYANDTEPTVQYNYTKGLLAGN